MNEPWGNAISLGSERKGQDDARGNDHAKMPLAGLYLVTGGKRLAVFYGDVRGVELWEKEKELEFTWERLERVAPHHWQKVMLSVVVRHPSLDKLRTVHEHLTQTRERFIAEADGFTIEIGDCVIGVEEEV